MSNLADLVPPHQEKALKPYLQRARDFEGKQPIVAYYLKTFVANEAMKLRKKDDAAGTKFLMTILDHLEAERTRLGAEVTESDGRTALTRAGLQLFSKADDLERTGRADLQIVKLFFAASQLFEATIQFTKDGSLDPIAAEKVKYSKYIAFRMKKALDSGQPYVSPNEIEAPVPEGPVDPMQPAPPLQPAQPLQPAAPLGQQQPAAPQQTYDYGQPVDNAPPPGFPQMPPVYETSAPANPSFGQQQMQPAPPLVTPQPAPPQPAQMQPAPPPTTVQPAPAAPGPAFTAAPGSGAAPDMDAMLASQKFAKQAVAALQFFDHANAREQLVKAINALDGKK